MITRTFSLENQISFAEISGDFNPLHVDPIIARRLLYGDPAVHGIHAALWAIDVWLKKNGYIVNLTSLKIEFLLPIVINQPVQYLCVDETKDSFYISILISGKKAVSIKASFLIVNSHEKIRFHSKMVKDECKEVAVSDILKVSGNVDLNVDYVLANKLFPYIVNSLSPIQISELLATTKIVGMQCPGLQSIFSSLALKFKNAASNCLQMNYDVEDFDERFSRITVNILSASASGRLYVFYRPPYKQQPSYSDMHKLVARSEFSDQRALIIGGSRGLGEVTAKLLASGGAEVAITYFRGSRDANSIVKDVTNGGGNIFSINYDVMSPLEGRNLSIENNWTPTHLYYFATPFIFDGVRGEFNNELFNKFCDYYVTGFVNAINNCKAVGSNLKKVYYPSSVAVDTPPADMIEYSAAKAAAESICRSFNITENKTEFIFDRLPRLDTDQTASVFEVDNNDPVPHMLRIVRGMSN